MEHRCESPSACMAQRYKLQRARLAHRCESQGAYMVPDASHRAPAWRTNAGHRGLTLRTHVRHRAPAWQQMRVTGRLHGTQMQITERLHGAQMPATERLHGCNTHETRERKVIARTGHAQHTQRGFRHPSGSVTLRHTATAEGVKTSRACTLSGATSVTQATRQPKTTGFLR